MGALAGHLARGAVWVVADYLIHQVSRDLPRAVNNLALQSLVAAYAAKKAIVDESSARAAVTEVTAK